MSAQAADQLPWNPNSTSFPTRKNLPKLPDAPDGAAWVWGKDDEVCFPVISTHVIRADMLDIVGQIEPPNAAESQGLCR